MMLNHLFYWLLPLCLVACDLPPGNIIDGETTSNLETSDSDDSDPDLPDTATLDTETEDTETEEDSEEETDSEPAESSCLEAMMCIALTPGNTLECLSGMEEEDARAARELAFCVMAQCADSLTDMVAFGACLMSPCAEEAVNCVGSSIF